MESAAWIWAINLDNKNNVRISPNILLHNLYRLERGPSAEEEQAAQIMDLSLVSAAEGVD